MADTHRIRNGLVTFAKDPLRVASSYQLILKMDVIENEQSHLLLQNDNSEIVVHSIPEAIAQNVSIETPPRPRENAAVKAVLEVTDLEMARRIASETGGDMRPQQQAWTMRGFQVIDAWDPEGNIVQLKQFANED